MDIQSASETLYWAAEKKPTDAFLQEHPQYFGTTSADDLQVMIDLLSQLNQQAP